MKRTATLSMWISAALLGVGIRAPGGPSAPGTLTLHNGDKFAAALEAFDRDTGALTVRHPFARDPIELPASAVRSFIVAEKPAPSPQNAWIAATSVGESIRGQLTRLDGERLAMDNIHAGAITLERRDITALVWSAAERVLYEGPEAGDVWQRSPNETFKTDGAAVKVPADSWAGPKLSEIPRRARMDFTLRLYAPNFRIAFYEQSLRSLNEGDHKGYVVQFAQDSNVLLMRSRPMAGLERVAHAPLKAPIRANARDIRFVIFADLERRRVAVSVENRIVADWTDDAVPEKPGAILAFYGIQQQITVSKIRVADWDGRLPGGDASSASATEDQIALRNGDQLAGPVLAIEPPVCRVRTRHGELSVPLINIHRIAFKIGEMRGRESDRPRLRLSDDSLFWIRLLKIEEGVAHIESKSAGPLRVPVSAIREIAWPAASDGGAPSPK